MELARANTQACNSRIRFHQVLFSQLGEVLAAEGVSQLDGLLADLGVSKYQLMEGERGFSLMVDGPLAGLPLSTADARHLTSSSCSNLTADSGRI